MAFFGMRSPKELQRDERKPVDFASVVWFR